MRRRQRGAVCVFEARPPSHVLPTSVLHCDGRQQKASGEGWDWRQWQSSVLLAVLPVVLGLVPVVLGSAAWIAHGPGYGVPVLRSITEFVFVLGNLISRVHTPTTHRTAVQIAHGGARTRPG